MSKKNQLNSKIETFFEIEEFSVVNPESVKYIYAFTVINGIAELIYFMVFFRNNPRTEERYNQPGGVWGIEKENCTAPKPSVPQRVFKHLLDAAKTTKNDLYLSNFKVGSLKVIPGVVVSSSQANA